MTKDWLEKKDRKMELKECSAEALDVAVNFMYGIKVPERFTELRELLHIAELFMMGNLAEVVVQRLAEELTKDNYVEISQTAELYNKDSLINKCARFVYFQMGDNVDWEVIGKLSNVMAAFGKIAMKKQSNCTCLGVMKKRENFASDELYGDYVSSVVKPNSEIYLRTRIGSLYAGTGGTVLEVKRNNSLLVKFPGRFTAFEDTTFIINSCYIGVGHFHFY